MNVQMTAVDLLARRALHALFLILIAGLIVSAQTSGT